MAGTNPGTKVYVANHRSIRADIVTLTRQFPLQQLPAGAVPDNVGVLVMSNPGNPPASLIMVDGKQCCPTSYPLSPGTSVPWFVQDTSAIWVGLVGVWPPGVAQMIINFTHEID